MTTEIALLLFNKAAEIGLAVIESRSQRSLAQLAAMSDDEVRAAVEAIEIPSAASLVDAGRQKALADVEAEGAPTEGE